MYYREEYNTLKKRMTGCNSQDAWSSSTKRSQIIETFGKNMIHLVKKWNNILNFVDSNFILTFFVIQLHLYK